MAAYGMIFLMQKWIGCSHLLWNVWWKINLTTTGRGWIEAEEEKLEPYLCNIWGEDFKWTDKHKQLLITMLMKVSQITFVNQVIINLYRSWLKWPQLQYFRNKRQITRWPTQSLWTVRTFATCYKFNSQFSILSCRCCQNHFAHVPLTIISVIIILTIKSMTMTLTFTSMTMTLTKFEYMFTAMITPMHNVHFGYYDGTVVKSWNPKIHFLMGKKYFWGYFSYVVLGRKL